MIPFLCIGWSLAIGSNHDRFSDTTGELDTIPDTYQKVYDLRHGTEHFGAAAVTPDGGMAICGWTGENQFSNEACLLKTDSLGNVEFAKILGFDAFSPPWEPGFTMDINEFFRDIVVMPDSGFLVLGPQRRRGYPPLIELPFLVRFDKYGNILWSKNMIASGISSPFIYSVNPKEDGSFLLVGNNRNGGTGFILEISSMGEVLFANTYSYPQLRLESNAVYSGSHTALQGLAFDSTKVSLLLLLDGAGNLESAKSFRMPPTLNEEFSMGYSLQGTGDGFLLGNTLTKIDNPSVFTRATLLKTDLDGNLLWSKAYRESNYNAVNLIDQIHVLPNGETWVNMTYRYYLTSTTGNPLFGNPNEAVSMVQLDQTGNIVQDWVFRGYPDVFRDSRFYYHGDGGFQVAGRVTGLQNGGLFSASVDSLGNGMACKFNDFDILAEPLPIEQDNIQLVVDTLNCYLEDFDLPVWDADIRTRDMCCEGLDWDIWYVGFDYPCPDSVNVTLGISNTSLAFADYDSLLVGVYDADPFLGSASLLYEFYVRGLPFPQGNNEYEIRLPLIEEGELFFLLNPPVSDTPPFDPICDFLENEQSECNYYNNLDSIHITSTYSITLDFGPDTLICPESEHFLAAGEHFTSYIWQDGSMDSLFEVLDTGLYWLEATDRCGAVHRDSISIGYHDVPQFDFGVDTVWEGCSLDTVFLSMPPGFATYQWWDNFGGGNSDSYIFCDTCADTGILTSITSGIGHRFFGKGTTDEGCEWKDTITFFVHPTYTWMPPQRDTFACAGGSIELGGIEYLADATVTVTLQTVHGCDSLIIYTILPLDTSYMELDTAACEGGALSIGGQSISAGSQQAVVYNSQQGCDSTVLYKVTPLPFSESMADTVICPGTSVSVFGSEESGPGTYTGNFTAANGCDSLHYFTIALFEEAGVEIITTPTCEGKSEGTAMAQISGGTAPYQLQWEDGSQDNTALTSLSVGSYGLTVTDANGCSQSLVFDINNYPLVEVPIRCEPHLYAPTAFSPNGDGVNDHFTLYSNNKVLEIIYLQVYDRWGEMVFEGKNIPPSIEALGWDGRLDGEFLNPGIFAWKALVRHESGEEELTRGDVVLVR